MESSSSLINITGENNIILLDNCVLLSSLNSNPLQSHSSLEKAIEYERNYANGLLDILNSSSVFITSQIQSEFSKGFGVIRFKFGNLAFCENSSLDFRKKIGSLQRSYFNIAKRLKSKTLSTLERNNSYLSHFVKIQEIVQKSKYSNMITDCDIGLYAMASFLNITQESAIITRDFDLLRIHNLCSIDSNFNLENGFGICNKIYMPINSNENLTHEYRLFH